MGASPIVMDFTEVFIALEAGTIAGVDASSLANNVGLYDILGHTAFPDFYSTPVDQITFNLVVWNRFPDDINAILDTAVQALALQTTMTIDIANVEAETGLKQQGVRIYDCSPEDCAEFCSGAQRAWDGWTAPQRPLLCSKPTVLSCAALAKLNKH